MKKYSGVLLLTFILSFPSIIFSQLDVYRFIGKSQSALIKALGKPAHIDNSNPSMVMIFYRSSDLNRNFVSDEEGIFQAQANQSFNSEKGAQVALNDCISEMIHKGFAVDTISVSEFNSEMPGISCKINYSLNTLTNKYVIYVSARRKES